jgi:hypothetical protein
MTAPSNRPAGRDEYPSRYDIIDAASGIEGIIDLGDEHPLIVESLTVALRVLRRAARMDAPDPESARDVPAGASAAPEADLVRRAAASRPHARKSSTSLRPNAKPPREVRRPRRRGR